MRHVDRRTFARESAGVAASACLLGGLSADEAGREPLPVAAVVTVYRENSHADVIVGKILDGYDQQGGPGPALKLAALYADQFPENDLSRGLARKHGFQLAKTIDQAITLGTDRLRVKGVLSIGEHGDYPLTPVTRQRMYPRRRFFDAIAATFRRAGQVVPVFNDKHLAYRWEDAKHMYDVAARMEFPLMAGSSLPVTWRRPPLALPRGCDIDEAMVVAYGGLESYGFHALETLQCMVERRKGGETGVASVRVFQGDGIIKARDEGAWSGGLFEAALDTMPEKPPNDLGKLRNDAAFYQIQYRDGLKATVAMANGLVRQKSFAAKLHGRPHPAATWFELDSKKPYRHFEHLTRAIEHMVHSGRPPYPADRTLLTTGMLDAIMRTLAAGGGPRETPELKISYQAADWPFANQEA